MKRLSFLILTTLMVFKLSAQNDSLGIESQFSTPEAWIYMDHVVKTNSFWRSQQDPLRASLERLLDHSTEHFDSICTKLLTEDFSLVEVHVGDPVVTDSTELKWLNDSTFLVDPHGWSSDLYLDEEIKLIYPEGIRQDLFVLPSDSTELSDTPAAIPDTLVLTIIDTSAIESLGIVMHTYRDNQINPSLDKEGLTAVMTADRSMVNYYRPGTTWKASEESPFEIVENEYQLDSLQLALIILLEFTSERDSTLLWVNDIHGNRSPFWLSNGDDEAYRYWVKNYNNDSITLWIGNPGPREISLLLEDDVRIDRLMKEEIQYLPEFVKIPERSLSSMTMLEPEPIYWDYTFSSVFTMNQTYLSNWTKGGESSFTTMIDVMGQATYNNKEANTQWINVARIQFGTLMTQDNGFRKSQDQFEINSKLNKNASGKIGMSSSFYMKNQLASGYDYSGDSALTVSKFLNPTTMTIGIGFEYKPFKNTTINMAPLSYKNTFVLDTALIDQTKHGIDQNKRARQELGTQIVLINTISPFEDMKITNRLRLFSNYLNHPENIDVDWEMLLDQKISWFFTIRLNLHLIYDDDVRFDLYDSDGEPVLNPDGSQKQVAKTQFKEFVGLSLLFKF